MECVSSGRRNTVTNKRNRMNDHFLASVIGGRTSPGLISQPADQDALLHVAVDHGVDVLLRHILRAHGFWASVPLRLQSALDTRARHQCVRDVLRTRELARVLRTFSRLNFPALVIKGAAISHTHYPASYLRPRYDTDLLIRRQDLVCVCRALSDLGYRRVNSVSREVVRTQWTFQRLLEGGESEYIDLHWAISNRPLFAGMLSFDELAAEAVRVPALSDQAADVRTPCPVHALLLACIHRVAHHNGWAKLIWLYDLRLLAGGLSTLEWVHVRRLAVREQIGALCYQALSESLLAFGATHDEFAVLRNEVGELAMSGEPSAAYLRGVGTRWQSLLLDLRAVNGLRAKLRLAAGHAFPDTAYMRETYRTSGALGLAAAYLLRGMLGVRRMMNPVERQA